MGNGCTKNKHGFGPSRNLTLAILGLDNAGKTVTTKGLQGESLDTVAPTVGFSSADFKFEGHNITLFDIGGGKRIRDIWRNYFSEVYGVIYVIDASEVDRMDECQAVLKGLLEHDKVSGKPVLVLANKQDKIGALDELDICDQLNIEELVNVYKCPCRVETCSAIIGQGKKLDSSIKSGLRWLLMSIENIYEKLNLRVEKDMGDQKQREDREKEERKERVRKTIELREKEESTERRLRGEEDPKDSDPEYHEDPFRRIDHKQLVKKEERGRLEKRRQKQLRNIPQSLSDPEDNGEIRSRFNHKPLRKHSDNDDDDDDDDDESDEDNKVPQQRPIKSVRSPHNHAVPPIGEPKKYSRTALAPLPPAPRSRLDRDSEDDEDDDADSDSGEKLSRMRMTPRAYDLKPLHSLQPRFNARGVGAGEEEAEARGLYGHRPLAPLAPLAPLEPLDSGNLKKKKKKPKKNQTAPVSSDQDDDEDYHPKVSPFAPRGWNTPPGQRSAIRASRSPKLATLQEPDNEHSDSENHGSFSRKWGLVDDLPGLPSSHRSMRPNSEYDDEIMT